VELRVSETREIENIVLPDGSRASRIPVSRRHHRFCLLLGFVFLPFFGCAPFVVEWFSMTFLVAWSTFAALIFSIWFWGSLSYLKTPDKFGLIVDSTGVRERLLTKELFWKWEGVDSVGLFDVDNGRAVGLCLKQRTWKRRWRLATYDAILQNVYAVSHSDILTHLQEWQQKYENAR